MSEFDPRTTALLERLAPAAASGPDAWADVVRRSERHRRWRLTRRRTLVLALADRRARGGNRIRAACTAS